jgi:hypothetical protein
MVKNPLIGKCLAVGIILLFIGVAVAPSINTSVVKASNDNDLVEVTTQACGIQGYGNRTSFHTNISGSKYWISIKVTFSGYANITVETYSNYTCNGSRINFFFDLYNPIYYDGYFYEIRRLSMGVNPEYYFKAQLGDWNWSWHHENQVGDFWGKEHEIVKIGCYNISPYLITFVSYTTNRDMDIWVNTSSDSNISYSTSSGTDVFAYDRYDFSGTVNIGSKRGTLIINGQKDIQINNQLFAWFDTGLVSTGFEILKYKSPTGMYNWKYYIDKKGEHTHVNESGNFGDFVKNLWWGTNGTWNFKVNMLNIGIKPYCPNIFLLGADIKLPE